MATPDWSKRLFIWSEFVLGVYRRSALECLISSFAFGLVGSIDSKSDYFRFLASLNSTYFEGLDLLF